MPPGGERPGAGRPAGSKNLLGDLRHAIRDLCDKKDYSPLEHLIDIVQDKENKHKLTLDQKITIHKELLQYIAPKLKAVDIQANVSGDIKINVVQFSEPKTIDVQSSQPTLQDNPIQGTIAEAIKQTIEEDDDDE